MSKKGWMQRAKSARWGCIAAAVSLSFLLYLLEPEQKHNMDQLAFQYLSYETVSYREMLGDRKRLRDVPIEELRDYACEDADITFRLFRVFEPMLHDREAWELFEKVEMPLVQVLAAMERKGVRVDTGYLKQYSGVLQERIAALEQQIYALAGETFNIASPRQLGVILFEKLRIVENAKLTKTKQYQTGEADAVLIAFVQNKVVVRQ